MLRILPLAAAAAVLALAGTASADSISFIRGGDIWVASPDGAKQVQVTHSGGYSYQSQADDGTFIALAGRRLHHVDRTGKVLADFSTPVSGEKVDDDTSYFMGPFDPEISPDGTKVVYSYLWQSIYNKPGCVGYKWLCQEKHLFQGVGYSRADAMTGWDEEGYGHQSGWVHPSWMGNDQVMVSTPSEPLNYSVMFDRVGTDNWDIQEWFSDGPNGELRDGELSRQGTTLAFVRGDKRGIVLYKMTGAAPAKPEQFCTLGPAAGTSEGLTWSPAGDRIAYADRAEDETGKVMVADLGGGCADNAKVVIDDARHPDWSPADVPAVAAPAAVGPAPAPQPVAPAPGKPKAVKAAATTRTFALSLRGRKLARALRRGVVVTYRAPAAGRISARALRGKRVVARRAVTASRGGAVPVRLRFTASARRKLRAQRSVRLSVRMTYRRA